MYCNVIISSVSLYTTCHSCIAGTFVAATCLVGSSLRNIMASPLPLASLLQEKLTTSTPRSFVMQWNRLGYLKMKRSWTIGESLTLVWLKFFHPDCGHASCSLTSLMAGETRPLTPWTRARTKQSTTVHGLNQKKKTLKKFNSIFDIVETMTGLWITMKKWHEKMNVLELNLLIMVFFVWSCHLKLHVFTVSHTLAWSCVSFQTCSSWEVK